jgi:hypothetical protein
VRGRPDAIEIENSVVEGLTALLAPEGWLQRSHEPDDEVAFVSEPVTGVRWHFSVNLGGDQGVSLAATVGVEHALVAEEQRRLFGWKDTVCQVGASMINLVNDAGQSPSILAWWVGSRSHVDGSVAQVVSDLRTFGEPFLEANLALAQIVETLNQKPKSQVEYGTLAVCYAVLNDLPRAGAMLAKFGSEKQVFARATTETFQRNFAERFGV